MKGIRGLLEKDFSVVFPARQQSFSDVGVYGIILYTNGKNRSYLHCNVYSIRYGSIFREYDQL